MTDFASVLSALPTFAPKQPLTIGRDALVAKATAMARRGYVHSATSLEALEAYLQGYGILLSGGLGVGKTLFFKVVNPEPIPVLSFNRCHLYKYDQLEKFLDETAGGELVLDDIGWNVESANNYGTRFETLQVVLDYRLTETAARTHVTTNCTNDELIGRFDAHLIDRIYQLCKCFVFPPAESRREAKPNLNYVRNAEYNRKMGREEL